MPLRFAVALGLLAACGAGDRQATGPSDLVIEKAPTNSGDRQVGVAGKPLEQDFRALVTRDGEPAEGVTVYWTTMQGSMNPVTDLTDADGISASRWTTKVLYTEQEAYASLQPVTGPRVPGSILPGMIQFTAIGTPDPDAANTVHVLTDGGNRFQPASITVIVGDTVNWLWPVGRCLRLTSARAGPLEGRAYVRSSTWWRPRIPRPAARAGLRAAAVCSTTNARGDTIYSTKR